ncbi:MAG: hypothetical protein V3R84_09555 [Acidimicrobiia bacterium]
MRRVVLLLAVGLIAGSCASESEGVPAPGLGAAEPVTTEQFECPVTVPNAFTPPDPYPRAATFGVWHGTAELWTVLGPDGEYLVTKGLWWSRNFPGGAEEEQPDISIVAVRLDADAPQMTSAHPGTNAHTPQDRWFMINGVDPEASGCWELTATYKGASLTYVYEAP